MKHFRQATQCWYMVMVMVMRIASCSIWLYLASSSRLAHFWVTPCVSGREAEGQRVLPAGYVMSYLEECLGHC